ncbi:MULTISPECIES: WD40 repeat domain-containing protein [Pseudomonas]|uniref:WD40 repeat domain-containing protein n=1 Tax=Pseudomonas TaxID=286 RepID=UPI001E51D4AA|nr:MULTISPECIES: WD40 repeat domain-containing protein [Pseudomonas]MCE1116753.1 WD40 repeat domain-containing protein [Pseudomonas sp. NMI795_08]
MNNPYVGPGPFGSHQHLFGRDAEIDELQWRLIADRIIVLYSPSGAGKTSLLMAQNGLVARLTERFHVLPVMRAVRKETTDPVEALLLQLEERGFGQKLADDTLCTYFSRLEIPQSHPAKRALLVLDQFEEIFTNGANAEQQRTFFNQLGELLNKGSVWFIASMREEYFSWLDSFREVIPTRLTNTFRLTQLTPDQAVEAVKGPAETLGVQFPAENGEDAAVHLVRELSKMHVRTVTGTLEVRCTNAVEPVLLQVICSDLWDRLASSKQVVSSIHIGDLANYNAETALQDYCDKALDMTAPRAPRGSRLRDWIDRKLLTHSCLRAPAMIDPADKDCPTLSELATLESVHLIRRQSREDGEWYELAHDRLASPIRRSIETWRLKNLEVWQQLAHAWHLGGEQPSYFKTLRAHSTRHFPKAAVDDQFSDTEVRFLHAYRQYHTSKWRWHGAWAVALTATLIGVFLSVQWVTTQANLAATRKANAVQAGVLSILGGKPGVDLGALATVVGVQLQEKEPQSFGLNFRTVLSDYLNKSRQIESVEALGDGKSRVVLFEPSRLILAEIGEGRHSVEIREGIPTTQAWKLDANALEQAHPKGIRTLALLGNDQLATGDSEGNIRVWNLTTRQLIGGATAKADDPNAPRMQSAIRSLTAAGDILYAGFERGIVGAWRIDPTKSNAPEPLWSARVLSRVSALATFDAGSSVAVTDISAAERVNLFSYANGKVVKTYLEPVPKEDNFKGAFYSIAISANRQFVAAGNRAGRIFIWSLTSRKLLLRLDAHERGVVQLSYLADGSLLSASLDGQLKRWSFSDDAQALRRVRTVIQLPRQLVSIAPVADGKSAFITTEKGDLLNVSLEGGKPPFGQLLPDTDGIAQVAVDEAVPRLFTANRNLLTVSTIDPDNAAPATSRHASQDTIVALARAPSAKALFIAQARQVSVIDDEPIDAQVMLDLPLQKNETILAINVNATGTVLHVETLPRNLLLALTPEHTVTCELKVPEDFPRSIRILAFRPNSQDFATVKGDKVRFWTVINGAAGCPQLQPAPYTLSKPRGDVLALTFDSTGNTLWFGNFVGQLYFATLNGPTAEAKPYQSASTVEPAALAVSEEGTVAMGDSNGHLYVYQKDSQLPLEIGQDFHESEINSLALAKDGQWLVSSSASGTAIWDLRLQSWINRACKLATDRDFSDNERAQYFQTLSEKPEPCKRP